ncbi:MAG: AlpA family phage regulatory protein [Phycisphaerales bacterium]|nr:MAG: AlpA family phage regulatory protein [Phycisphaerales bacterium]
MNASTKEHGFRKEYDDMGTTIEAQDRLLSAASIAKLLSLSRRQVFRLNSGGRIPAPIRIGGAVRWSAKEVSAWLAAGAPDRKTWEAIKGNGGQHG